jgi:Kef-type K+ transport system membrane component KefB
VVADRKPTDNFTLAALATYIGMVAGAVAVFLVVRRYGEGLTAPAPIRPPAGGVPTSTATSEVVFHLLVALAAVIVAGRLLGWLLRSAGQPPVIGEVVGGILLGPSFLGRVAPGAAAYILPSSVAPLLGSLAQVGVVLYMFFVGLGLNTDLIRRRAQTTVLISHASIVAPFVLGSMLAVYLYPRLSSSDVSFTSFALFIGVAMSITAFPVLARILTDRGISQTELGVVALTCAAADDVTAWCLLALVVGVAQASVTGAVMTLTLTLIFITLMFVAIRPLVSRACLPRDDQQLTPGTLTMVLIGLALSAFATDSIGIHSIFGAFLFGAIVPSDSAVARWLVRRPQSLVLALLLPAFFAFTGMRTEIGLLSGPSAWLTCGLIVVVATAGKFCGTLMAARLTGMAWHQAAGLGALMNTRGLMELVVLNVGLDLNVISPALFAMMVVMALVTTLATAPALAALQSRESL